MPTIARVIHALEKENIVFRQNLLHQHIIRVTQETILVVNEDLGFSRFVTTTGVRMDERKLLYEFKTVVMHVKQNPSKGE